MPPLPVRHEHKNMSNAEKLLEYHFPARPEHLCGMRAKLRETLVSCGASEATLNCIILAVGEACMNIMQHAYRQEPGDIVVEVRRKGESLVFRLRDFAPGRTCPKSMRSRPLDEIRPGGLGCHIINEVMDEVKLINCSAPCGHILQMKKTLED